MVNIPTFKAPDPSSLTGNLSGIGSNLPSPSSIGLNSPINASLGANLPKIPSMGGLSSGLPGGEALKNAVPNFSAPSIPSDIIPDAKTKIAESLPKFDSKIDLPEIQTGKLGLLSSPVDLGEFKEKSMSRLSSIVPEFSPGTKISALNALADKKAALLDALKSGAGGALSGAIGGVAGALASGQSLKDAAGSIAKSAIGGAVGGVVGNLASKAGVGGQIAGAIGGAAGTLAAGGNLKQAAGSLAGGVVGSLAGNLAGKVGIPGNVSSAVGSAAGALAAGGNLKQAVGGAAGNLVASTVVGKLGGGVVGTALGAVAGAKISGASTKSSLIGGLTAGAGAFALSKIMPASTGDVIPNQSQEKVEISKDINIVTSANNEPSVPETKSIPPASPTATIDSETGKVTLSNTSSTNTTTIKETVIKGGSRTTYADRYNPSTGKYEPVPDTIVPPNKTETKTVVNNNTGDVISSSTTTSEITSKEAKKETSSARVSPPTQEVKTNPAPTKLPRPINPVFAVDYDLNGNEILVARLPKKIIPSGLEMVSMVGSKDTLTCTYVDGSTRVFYSKSATISKFGYTNTYKTWDPEKDAKEKLGFGNVVDTLPNGETSTWLNVAKNEDYSLPAEGDSPYFVKNSDGSITYTFSDGTVANELPSGNKSIITIQGVSADVDIPVPISPTSLEMPAEELESKKRQRKVRWMRENENTFIIDPKAKVSPEELQKIKDDEFEKDWSKDLIFSVKDVYAKELAEKYKKLNEGEQVKTAESVDKNYVIEVVRSGYNISGDSFKIKSVRLYKKTEQVT